MGPKFSTPEFLFGISSFKLSGFISDSEMSINAFFLRGGGGGGGSDLLYGTGMEVPNHSPQHRRTLAPLYVGSHSIKGREKK